MNGSRLFGWWGWLVACSVVVALGGSACSSDSRRGGGDGGGSTDAGGLDASGGDAGGSDGGGGDAGPAPLSCTSYCAEAESCGEASAYRCECACGVHEAAMSAEAWDALYAPCYGLSCEERETCVSDIEAGSRLGALDRNAMQESACTTLCAVWESCGYGDEYPDPDNRRAVCERVMCGDLHLWSDEMLGELTACTDCDTLFECIDGVHTDRGLSVDRDVDEWVVTQAECPSCDPADPCSEFCALDCFECPDREGCCTTGDDCTEAGKTRCNDQNQCVQCTSSTQCPVSAQFCRGGECVQCTDSPDCPPSRPLCNDGVCESL